MSHSVSSPDETLRDEKYNMQRSLFDKLQGVPDETLCKMLDITFQTKWL